jgi:hypothetical protein
METTAQWPTPGGRSLIDFDARAWRAIRAPEASLYLREQLVVAGIELVDAPHGIDVYTRTILQIGTYACRKLVGLFGERRRR